MKILKNIPALQNFCDMLYTKSMGFNIKMLLTPSVHKTVMRCFSSCPFYTENPHRGVYKRWPIIFD